MREEDFTGNGTFHEAKAEVLSIRQLGLEIEKANEEIGSGNLNLLASYKRLGELLRSIKGTYGDAAYSKTLAEKKINTTRASRATRIYDNRKILRDAKSVEGALKLIEESKTARRPDGQGEIKNKQTKQTTKQTTKKAAKQTLQSEGEKPTPSKSRTGTEEKRKLEDESVAGKGVDETDEDDESVADPVLANKPTAKKSTVSKGTFLKAIAEIQKQVSSANPSMKTIGKAIGLIATWIVENVELDSDDSEDDE